MDTGTDFIRPEFLNILFFQQKNLVIFPYVDMKHLHALETFTVGYTIIDLESTALHNIREILEFEKDNSYSQNPTLFFITNVSPEHVKEIMTLDNVRCIINTNENITELANGSNFIFFNKKNSQFLNYDLMDSELEFEKELISESEDEHILQEKIQKIKLVATRIFKQINSTGDLSNLPEILKDYDQDYWSLILEYTSRYYDINIPKTSNKSFSQQASSKDFSREYEAIISSNRQIGKEFIQLMHDYREKHVNPANLELEELYVPLKLYNYLRNHHWEQGIPEDFISKWVNMENSGYHLSEEDNLDFEMLLGKLGLEVNFPYSVISEPSQDPQEEISSPKADWLQFRQQIDLRLKFLKEMSINLSRSSELYHLFFDQISDIKIFIDLNLPKNEEATKIKNDKELLMETIKRRVISKAEHMRLDDWISIYTLGIFRFIPQFFRTFENLHDAIFEVDDKQKIDNSVRIKAFKFPKKLEDEMFWFKRFRNEIAIHGSSNLEDHDKLIRNNQQRVLNVYFNFLSYLIKYLMIKDILDDVGLYNQNSFRLETARFIVDRYLKNGEFSIQETDKLLQVIS